MLRFPLSYVTAFSICVLSIFGTSLIPWLWLPVLQHRSLPEWGYNVPSLRGMTVKGYHNDQAS
jgi:hypothetical protein